MVARRLSAHLRAYHCRGPNRNVWRAYSAPAANHPTSIRIPFHSNGSIDLDIYNPPSSQQRDDVLPRVLLHLPPGPLLRRGSDGVDTALGEVAAKLSCPVVKINYRLSPEHLYPGPIHDVLAAYDWVKQNLLAKRSITRLGRSDVAGRIAVQGESIGGGLAAMLAMTECHRGQPGIIAAALHNPLVDWVDLDPNDPHEGLGKSVTSSEESKDLSAQLIAMRGQVFRKPEHYFDPFASPMLFLRSSGVEVPAAVRQIAPLDDMAELALHTRELSNEYASAILERSLQSAAEVPVMPRRKTAKRYPNPALGLKLPPFNITTDSESPLYAQTQEFVKRLRQSHTRQLQGTDFGRKVLTENEIQDLSDEDRQEYDDIDAEARGMVASTTVSDASAAACRDQNAIAWLRNALK